MDFADDFEIVSLFLYKTYIVIHHKKLSSQSTGPSSSRTKKLKTQSSAGKVMTPVFREDANAVILLALSL